MITRLLVANRAEIASRVFRTCRRLGIATVAVHSDADAGLPYVGEADAAVRLPGDAPADTYLRTDLLLDAARAAGAVAIHPGYGFLSENAEFAQAVLDAGLVWVGPAPDSIRRMGSKIEAKQLMEAAGVPVLRNLTPETATEADLPLIVKASAGGGGRGMRIVRRLADLPGEIETAAAEAASAFGDGTCFVETFVERGRHVEVQVVGQAAEHGGVLVFGERDCSLQRRHQKVVEESPAPNLPDATRAALHEAARKAAAAIDYRGAGTVEFLYDEAADRFFFLEMNTRLQVEHPVTELVHDVDLVAAQLAVAEGRAVDPPRPARGHAVEVRLYAEDPAADYQPSSGPLTAFDLGTGTGTGADVGIDTTTVRVDAGYAAGSSVSTHYDAMLAKVMVHAPERAQAARALAGVLARARVHGPATNRHQLVTVLREPEFLAGRVSTAFLTEHPPAPSGADGDHAAAAALALAERARRRRQVMTAVPVAWRNVPSQPQRTEFDGAGPVRWWGGRDGYRLDGDGAPAVAAVGPDAVTLVRDGVATRYDVAVSGPPGAERVDVDAPGGHVALRLLPRFVDPADAVASGSLLAPMPGTVVRVQVAVGETVTAGAPVLVLEAMKMQHTVSAPTDGVVTQLDVEPGSQVAAGEVLAVVEATTEEQS